MEKSVTFEFSSIKGDLNDVHDLSKTVVTPYRATMLVSSDRTFRQCLGEIPEGFNIDMWRVIYAGNHIFWDELVANKFHGKRLHLISRIVHWSDPRLLKSNPAQLDWNSLEQI